MLILCNMINIKLRKADLIEHSLKGVFFFFLKKGKIIARKF